MTILESLAPPALDELRLADPDKPLASYTLALASDPAFQEQYRDQVLLRISRWPLRCELLGPGVSPAWLRGDLGRDDVIASDGPAGSVETSEARPWWPEFTEYRYGLTVAADGGRGVWLAGNPTGSSLLEPADDGTLPAAPGTYQIFAHKVVGPTEPLPRILTIEGQGGSLAVRLGERRSDWAVAQQGRIRARFTGDLYVEIRRASRQSPQRHDVIYGVVLRPGTFSEPSVIGVWGAESGGW